MARPVTLRIIIEDGNGEQKVRRLTDAFEQTERAARRAAQASSSITDRDVFARAAQTSRQFLNEMINSGGMRQYQEVLRQFAPQLRALQEQLRSGSFNQEDFNRRVSALPPLLQRALRDVSSLGRGIEAFGDSAEHGANGLQSMLIKADLAGRVIAATTQKVSQSWQSYLDFGKEVANISTIVDDAGDVSKLKQGLLELDPQLGSTTDLARGMYAALSSDVGAGDALKFITDSAKAARAGLATTFETVDAGTTIMASYKIEARDVMTIYDKMFQVAKDGKAEFPALSQSIGQVASIASLAGVSLNELFAAVATASLTNKPSVAIEGLRTALSNIIKPSEQAKDLAESLGLEFSVTALKAKGLSGFLQDVSEKTGNSADKLNILFGDVQGFNIVASLAGNNADKFADRLENMANSAGNVEAAFAKQQQSLGTQFEVFLNRIERGFVNLFTFFEPVLKAGLSAFNSLLPVIIAVTVAVIGLKAAWLLLNTQMFATAAGGIGNTIAALQMLWQTLLAVRAGTASLQATLAVATGGLALLGAAIGLAVYAWSSYSESQKKSIEDQQKAIQAANGQIAALNQQKQTLSSLQGDVSGLTLEQKELADIYATLDSASKNRVDAAIAEKGAVGALADEIERLNKAKGLELDSRLIELAEKTYEAYQKQKVAAEQARVAEELLNQARVNGLQDVIAVNAKTGLETGQVTKTVEQQFETLRNKQLETAEASQKATAEYEQLKGALQTGTGLLGMTADKFLEAKEATRQMNATSQEFRQTLAGTTVAQNDLANGLNNTSDATKQLTNDVFNLRQELNKLTAASQEKIDREILSIVQSAKNKAEARKMAQEALKNNADLKNAVEETKRIREAQKAAEEIFSPSERSSGGAARRTRTPNPAADFRRENRVVTGNAQWDTWVYELSQKYGVDPNLVFAMMQQESGFRRNAVSNKGAGGLLQLMPGTFAQMRVGGNRFDPRQNIEAGIKYLRQQLETFNGDTALALAAYNAGPGAVLKHNGIPPYAETRDYVRKISANYQRVKGKPEFSGNFDFERSLQEQSDRLTEQAKRARADEAMRVLRTSGMMPDSDAIQDIIRFRQQDARNAGLVQPDADAIRREIESRARSTESGGGIDIELQKTALEILREKYNLTEREEQVITRRLNMDKEVSVILEDQALARKEATLQAEIDYKVLLQRNIAEEVSIGLLEQRNDQIREIGDIERDLLILRRQNSDSQFVEQRRLLAAKREQFSLEQQITELQDEIANAGINDSLKIQAAYLRDIIELREREVDAVIAINRAELEISKSMEVSSTQIKARVYEHLAQQKTLNESIADGIIDTYEAVAERVSSVLDDLNEKTKGFFAFLIEPAKALQRNFLTKITKNLLDSIIPGFGTEATKTQNPIARPIVDVIGESNKILQRIENKMGVGVGGSSIGSAASAFGLKLPSWLTGSPFGQSSGGFGFGSNSAGFPVAMSATGDGSTRPRVVPGQPIRNAGGNWWDNLKNLFSTNEGGIFARRGGDGTPGSGSRMAGILGGAGDIAAMVGGMVGGRWGGVISMAGTGMSIGSYFGPWGAAIGAGVGALVGLLGGDPKRKQDKKENLPALQKGFTDAFQEFQHLIEDLKFLNIDGGTALTKARELRAQIAGGFGIQFQSKKYKKESDKLIKLKLAEIDRTDPDPLKGGLMQQVQYYAEQANAAGERRKLVAEFATGVYMDSTFMAQYGDFKRRNGMLPGTFTGKDTLPSMLAPGEMVLNPSQMMRIIRAVGYDPFVYGGVPNFPQKQPQVVKKYAEGSYIGATPALAPTGKDNDRPIVLNALFEVKVSESDITEVAIKALETDEGKRVNFNVINEGKKQGKVK